MVVLASASAAIAPVQRRRSGAIAARRSQAQLDPDAEFEFAAG